MSRITNCPNCGAVLDKPRCKYCGSCVVDFADITPNSKDIIYIRINDTLLATKCADLRLETQYNSLMYMSASFDGIDRPVYVNREPEIRFDCKFVILSGGENE